MRRSISGIVVCGVAAYVIWLCAGNIYVRDILLVQSTSYEMEAGKIIAATLGGIALIFMPLSSAINFHKRSNEVIKAEAQRIGWVAFMPVVAAGIFLGVAVGILPDFLSPLVQHMSIVAGWLR